MKEAESIDEQALRATVAANGSRFRTHTGVILTFSFLCAVGTSALLMHGGISELWLRYGLASIAGYVIFLGLYLLWYQHIRHELQAELLSPARTLRRPRASKPASSAAGTKSHPIAEFFGEVFANLLVDEWAIAIGVLLIAAAVAIAVIASPYIVLDLALGEALLLATTRRTSQFAPQVALGKIATGTLALFVPLLVAIEAWAFLLTWLYPGASSIGQVLEGVLRR